nr:T-cell receptor alpha chain V region HPB-MLT precursor [Oncorhynchus mykiss]
MGPWLSNLLILAACCYECKGEDSVIQPPGDVITTEGEQVTLGCQFDAVNINNLNLFWYKHELNGFPEFMLGRFSFGSKNATEFKDRPDANLDADSKSVPLTIQRVQLSDSAVYYCALSLNTGNKIIFGVGTQLIIQAREKHDPSYYSLKSRNTTACLATDFSAHNATTHLELFNKTEATRMNGDSHYSQVALGGENCTEVGGSEKCEANWYFDTDAKINFLSLTILGLRILFLKTIVFNVLITLRLWMS